MVNTAKCTPLFYCQSFEVGKMLIDAGANIGAKNRDGENVLHIALRKGYLELTMFFLEQGADVMEKNEKNGDTLLHIAVQKNYSDCVQALLQKGLSPTISNKRGSDSSCLSN